MSAGLFHFLLSSGVSNTALLIVGYDLDILNRYVLVNFDPNVYGSSGGALLASELQIANFVANGGATGATISSITKPDGNPLVGGEQQVKINLSATGGSFVGGETFEIKPSASGSYKDGSGNLCSPNDTTGEIELYLELDALYKAGVLLALNNSITPPALVQRLIDNTLFTYWRAQGVLLEWDFLYLFTHSNAWATINFINGTIQGSFTGTVTITQFSGGIASSGGYFSTGWNPLTHGIKWLQNDASLWVMIGNDGTTANIMMGMRGSGSGVNFGHSRVQGRNVSSQSGGAMNINSGGNSTVASVTDSIGFQGVSREASNLTRHYKDGAELTTAATASNTLSNRPITVWSENQDGTQSSSNTIHEAMLVCGGSGQQDKITVMNTGAQNWKTSTKALIPSAVADRFYQLAGQSELNGGGILWTSLTAGQLATYDIGPYNLANVGANCYVKSEIDDPWAILEPRVNGITGSGATDQFGEIFVIALAEAAKHLGEDLYFLVRPIDGTFIVNPSGANIWLEGGVASSAWERYLDVYQAGLAELDSVSIFEPVIWWQGTSESSDQDDGTLAAAYQAREVLVLDQFANNTGATAFVVAQIHSGLPAGYPYKNTVRAAKVTNAAGYPYTLISMDDLTLDVQHPSPASQIIIAGLRLSDEMI